MKIQPLPCVFLVLMRSARNSVQITSVVKNVSGEPALQAAFMMMFSGPISRIARAASFICSSVVISRPVSAPASCRLGVTTVASGSSLVLRASIASGFSRRAPLLAIITGSVTRGPSLRLEIAVNRVDDLGVSEHSCLHRVATDVAGACFDLPGHKLRLDLYDRVYPVVFCAVRAVIAVMPKAPNAETVFRSA